MTGDGMILTINGLELGLVTVGFFIALAGEDTVHEDDHRALVRLRAESFRQANLEGNSALRSADFVVFGVKSE